LHWFRALLCLTRLSHLSLGWVLTVPQDCKDPSGLGEEIACSRREFESELGPFLDQDPREGCAADQVSGRRVSSLRLWVLSQLW
jgi:hypothetical protein